jgi:hypothetical protein
MTKKKRLKMTEDAHDLPPNPEKCDCEAGNQRPKLI